MEFTIIKQSVLFQNAIQETLGLGQPALVSKDNSLPKAYINYLFFDKDNNFKSGGYRQVSEVVLGSVEELRMDFTPEEEGTIMIYTANQTAEDLDVYMDDMMVMHTEGPIIRVDDYYPFGLTFNTSERSGYLTNKFLYNSVELQEELGYYHTFFRMYDPALGRFNTTDKLGELIPSISGYHFGFNNPITHSDPSGLFPSLSKKRKPSGSGDPSMKYIPYEYKKSKNKSSSSNNSSLVIFSTTVQPESVDFEGNVYSLGIAKSVHEPTFQNTGWDAEVIDDLDGMLGIVRKHYSKTGKKLQNLLLVFHGNTDPNNPMMIIGDNLALNAESFLPPGSASAQILSEIMSYVINGGNVIYGSCNSGNGNFSSNVPGLYATNHPNNTINTFFNKGRTTVSFKRNQGSYQYAIPIGGKLSKGSYGFVQSGTINGTVLAPTGISNIQLNLDGTLTIIE